MLIKHQQSLLNMAIDTFHEFGKVISANQRLITPMNMPKLEQAVYVINLAGKDHWGYGTTEVYSNRPLKTSTMVGKSYFVEIKISETNLTKRVDTKLSLDGMLVADGNLSLLK